MTSVSFYALRLPGSPAESPRKVAQKGSSVAPLKEIIQLGCVSHDSPKGSNHTVKFSKTTMRREKIWKRMVLRRESFKSVNLRAKSMGSQIQGKNASGAPAETPGNWQRMFSNSKSQKILSSVFDNHKRETFRDRLWSFNANVKEEGLEV